MDEELIYTDAEIDNIIFRESFMYDMLDQDQAVEFLARMKLINNSMLCDNCGPGTEMMLQKKTGKRDGYIWCCSLACSSCTNTSDMVFF